ncbi:MAG: hypothetical protein JW934_04490 [Anaerolineae bacterium]|nr:hypothetical protein [Anaerolineae bacterium]
MSSSVSQHKPVALVSFPLGCPECGRQTVHVYGQDRKYRTLGSWSWPVERPWFYVRCSVCQHTRLVSKEDQKKLRPLTDKKHISFNDRNIEDIPTSLGKASGDWARLRILRATRPMGMASKIFVKGFLLLLLVGIGYVICTEAVEFFQDTCWVAANRLAIKADDLIREDKSAQALHYMSSSHLMFRLAGKAYKHEQVATLIVRGHLNVRLKNYRRAITIYQKSLKMSSKSGLQYIDLYAWQGLGIAYEVTGQSLKAADAYKAAESMLTERHQEDQEFIQERMKYIQLMLSQWLDSA